MQSEVFDVILPMLQKMCNNQKADWMANAKLKMTMLPSVGFFIVMPIASCPRLLARINEEEIEDLIERIGSEIGWKYCFCQSGQQDNKAVIDHTSLIFFQNSSTKNFEKKFGDLYNRMQE